MVNAQGAQEEEYSLYNIREKTKDKSISIDEELGGQPIRMELDTGATKTIISEETYNKLCKNLTPLRKTTVVLSTYTGERIPVAGKVMVPVRYENQQHNLLAFVVKGQGQICLAEIGCV
jgi:hypothetical protein